ncbi:hypothetical protein OB69_03610 [Roseivirga seohaensis subsp. aquiponti]|uniref:RHS repeat-associated core domain-containing protein n=1 Tax=Roseivirga seohaensis subsp. aquiponti TaxID=1566026 RepID=A0A0L8APE1_9BACT|nr:RHS repeat-associated core domain-containing protein [Roseivirga seohaensis]KOF04085.1 hypothetical protein OB69_03610 [Roseivirga seohaensis subsp. aquiponti]
MTSAASGAHEKLSFNTVNITQGGYVYVYLSNEGQTGFDVYFDDLNITHTKGAILQEDHYYLFGANISALSSTAPLSKPNKFKLSGNEEQVDFDWNVYDFNARMYDAALGRFMNIDPMADSREWLTPYNYVQNNPMIRVDPSGTLDDYKLNQDGSVELLEETDDKYDRLYATDKNGNVKESKYVQVDKKDAGDGTIISDLSVSEFAGEHTGGTKKLKSIATTGADGQDDVFKLFLFASNNSEVEWSAVRGG